MRILRIIISITLPIFLVMLFASLLTTTPYLKLSKGVYASHEEIDYDHDYAIERIIGYLNYRYDDLYFGMNEDDDSVIMDLDDIIHMKDVLDVYTMLRLVALSALIIAVSLSFVLYKKDEEMLYKTYKYMFIGPMFFIVFVGGYIALDFNTAFTAFHQIFFAQGGWQLSGDSVLIRLLPEMFWLVSGVIILVSLGLSLALTNYLANLIHKKKRS